MGFFTSLVAVAQPDAGWVSRSPLDDYWYEPRGADSSSGVPVTAEGALTNSSAYAGVWRVAMTIATVPLVVYKRLPNEGKERAPDHPNYRLLHDQPNRWQTSVLFRAMMQLHLMTRGNAYAQRVYDANGALVELIPFHPRQVTPRLVGRHDLQYHVQYLDGTRETLLPDEILHVCNLSANGFTGLAPMELGRDVVGLALAAERHAAKVFRNGAAPGGIVKAKKTLSKEAKARIRDGWNVGQGGENTFGTAVLDEEMDFLPVMQNAKDAQMLETRKHQVREMARLMNIQPHKIGDMEQATFANIEHQGLEYVTDTILPWAVTWEQVLKRDLFADDDTYFPEFVLDGLARGDMKSRYEAHNLAVQGGWQTRNEVRAKENMNALPGLDEPLQPLNMVSATDASGETDAAPPAPTRTTPAPDPAEDDGNTGSAREASARPLPDSRAAAAADIRAAFQLLAEDVGTRIANAETRELERRAPKATQDRVRFNAWLAEHFVAQRAYAEVALQPVALAWARTGGGDVDLGALLDRVAGSGTATLLDCPDVAAALPAWRAGRPGVVGALILHALSSAPVLAAVRDAA